MFVGRWTLAGSLSANRIVVTFPTTVFSSASNLRFRKTRHAIALVSASAGTEGDSCETGEILGNKAEIVRETLAPVVII